MIYIVTFVVAMIFMRKAEKTEHEHGHIKYLILSGLLLTLLAAFRDITVGHDVMLYQIRYLEAAKTYGSFISYMTYYCIPNGIELLYATVTYIAKLLGGTKTVLFFLNEAIIIFFTYKSLWDYKDDVSPTVSLAYFLFLYYLRGFDQTRQFMAVAVVLYSFTLFNKQKYLQSVIFIIMAMGFHSSAIVGFGLLVLFMTTKSGLRSLYKGLIFISTLVLTMNFSGIFTWVIQNVSLIPDKYLLIIRQFQGTQVNVAGIGFLTYAIAIGILLLIKIFGISEFVNNYDYLVYMMLFSLAGCFVQTYAAATARIFAYTDIYSIFVIPLFPKLFRNDDTVNVLIPNLVVYGFGLSSFVFLFMMRNAGEVYPYVFSL